MEQRASDLDNLFGARMGNRLIASEGKSLTRILYLMQEGAEEWRTIRTEEFCISISLPCSEVNKPGNDKMGFEAYHIW
jgi:hypothetical protein